MTQLATIDPKITKSIERLDANGVVEKHYLIGNRDSYVPTAEDIENDRKLEAWRKRQREADARVILSQIEVKRRAAVQHCIDAWEARIGSAA